MLHTIVPVLSSLLRELIAGRRDEVELRDAVARLLAAVPLISRAAYDEARADPTLDAMRLYEHTRMLQDAPRTPAFFLDHCPTSLVVFGAPSSVTLPVDDLRDLTTDNALADRHLTVQKLEGKTATRQTLEQLDAAHHTPDLPAALPSAVRIFISRLRAVHVGLRAAQPADRFTQCAHAQCNRFFFCGEPTLPEGGADDAPAPPAYAREVGAVASFASDCRRFCSHVCAQQWWRQYKYAVGLPRDRQAVLAPTAAARPHMVVCDFCADDVPNSRTGRKRPAAEFRAALKRNVRTTAAMRAQRRSHMRALSDETIAEARAQVAKTLSVDACVLYAAKVCAESGVMLRDAAHGVPGEWPEWRQGAPEVYTRAVRLLRPLLRARFEGARDPILVVLTSDTERQLLAWVQRRVVGMFL